MSDYRVRVSVRNARLLRAIEQAGHRPGPQFANAVGISYSGALLPYLNLTRSPLTPDGLLRECAWALCDFLQASPSDLWSDAQLQPLQQNYSSVDLDADSVQSLVSGTYTVDDPLLEAPAQPPAVAVAVPDEMESVHDTPFMSADTEPEIAYRDGWNACRAAMLAAAQKGGA